jgi:PKD repeat protein
MSDSDRTEKCLAKDHPVFRLVLVVGFLSTLVACGGGSESTSAGNNSPPGGNELPVANIAASSVSGTTPFTVRFNANGSSDIDGTIVAFEWDFGDNNQASGAEVQHIYTSAGSFTAVLTVTDSEGATSSAQRTITATEPTVDSAQENTDISAVVYLLLGNRN